MKYAKMLGLAALAATALMAWIGASTASATIVDCTGLSPCPVNEVIHAEAEETVTLHPPFGDITCTTSTIEGKLEEPGSATGTASGPLTKMTFGGCNATVTVLRTGRLEIHTPYENGKQIQNSNNNGTLTSSGAEVTVEFFGTHCIFTTSETDIGKLTGSSSTGSNPTLHIEATIPRTGGRSGAFCGSTAQWTGSYKVTKPALLDVT